VVGVGVAVGVVVAVGVGVVGVGVVVRRRQSDWVGVPARLFPLLRGTLVCERECVRARERRGK